MHGGIGVSDLQCAARVLVARHGEAGYETEALSDHGGTLTAQGREQARALGSSLVERRIARVWSSPLARAVQTAEIAAAALGCDVTVREGLRELSVGAYVGRPGEPDPLRPTFDRWLAGDLTARIDGAESGAEIVDRFRAVLDEVADLHRGEAVLVISHGGAIGTAVPVLADNLASSFPRGRPMPNCGVVELEADADGWVARSWCGAALDR